MKLKVLSRSGALVCELDCAKDVSGLMCVAGLSACMCSHACSHLLCSACVHMRAFGAMTSPMSMRAHTRARTHSHARAHAHTHNTGVCSRAEEEAASSQEEAVSGQAAPDTALESRRDTRNRAGERCQARRLRPARWLSPAAQRSGASGAQ